MWIESVSFIKNVEEKLETSGVQEVLAGPGLSPTQRFDSRSNLVRKGTRTQGSRQFWIRFNMEKTAGATKFLQNLNQLTVPSRNRHRGSKRRLQLLTCLLNSSSFSIHMYSANGSSSEPNWLLRTTSPVPVGVDVVPMVGSFMSLRTG